MGCTDGSMRIFEYPSLEELYSETSHYGQCNTLDQHPRGGYAYPSPILALILTMSWLATWPPAGTMLFWECGT